VITNSGQNIISSSIGSQVPIAVTLVNTSSSPVTISASSQTLPAGLTLASGGGSTLVIPPITSGTPGSNSSTIYLTYTPPTNTRPGMKIQSFVLNSTRGSKTTPVFVPITTAITPFGVNNLLYSSPSLGNVGSTASGTGTQKIPVYFYTDNSGLATAVSLTLSAPQYAALAANGITLTDSGGSPLSSSSQLLCSSVSGTSCGLSMNYNSTTNPSFNGQVIFPHSYFNAGGVANSGIIALTLTPSLVNTQVMTNVVGGSNVQAVYNHLAPSTATTVTIDFTANTTGGVLNSVSAALPAGWSVSSAPTLPCNILISPSACSITYSYIPTSVGESGTFSVSYTSTVGSTTSTANIPITYSSVAPSQPSVAQFLPFRYLSPFAGGVLPSSVPPGTGTNVILKCPIAGDGTTTLTSCSVAATMPTLTSDYYQSIEIVRFDATHQYLYAISPTTQKIARCTLMSSDPINLNYGNFNGCTTNIGGTAPNTAIPATGIGIARMADGNTYIFYEALGGHVLNKCLLNSSTGDASACVPANTPSITQPDINNAYSFDFTYDSNNDATQIYITDINPPAKLYTCALDSSGGFAVSQPATCKNGITLPADFSPVSYKPQSIRIKKINAINYAFIGADNSTPTGKIFICQINPSDGGFGSTPQCTGAFSYQGGVTSGFTPKGGIQVYPDANYLYAAIGDTTHQPSVCQIDMDCLSKNPASISSCSPGGIFPMGSGVQSCHAIDSNNPGASLSAFGLW
jgi:hypothetical protein